jgi:hypothetical protein
MSRLLLTRRGSIILTIHVWPDITSILPRSAAQSHNAVRCCFVRQHSPRPACSFGDRLSQTIVQNAASRHNSRKTTCRKAGASSSHHHRPWLVIHERDPHLEQVHMCIEYLSNNQIQHITLTTKSALLPGSLKQRALQPWSSNRQLRLKSKKAPKMPR